MNDEFRKLPKQPLNCVLAEFKFSQILKIQEHIPDIQESIRKTYPVLNRADQQTVQIAGPNINIATSLEWIFSTQDQRSAVIIGTDRLVFITSSYDRFPAFSEGCLSVLSTLLEVADPTLLLRIGLRYNDFIPIEKPEESTEIVGSRFLPSDNLVGLGDGINHYRTETSVRTHEGALLVRSLLGKHGLAVMPDLNQALPVKLAFEGNPEKDVLLLDFDHSWVAEQPGETFKLNVAKKQLNSLHRTVRAAFWEATTEHARSEIWT